ELVLEPHGRPMASRARRGAGAVRSFEVRYWVNPARMLTNLQTFRLPLSLGTVEGLAEYPARMTHFELPRSERLKVGVTDEMIRLAVGIEDVRDLIEDLDQALAIAAGHARAPQSLELAALFRYPSPRAYDGATDRLAYHGPFLHAGHPRRL
ncbi:UNVERIFIED_CONTAM: hypothetical protein DV093_08540, partial [Bifidobacterium animalis subsp. lactis]